MNFNQPSTMMRVTAAASNSIGYNEEIVRETLKLNETDKLVAPRNQEEF